MARVGVGLIGRLIGWLVVAVVLVAGAAGGRRRGRRRGLPGLDGGLRLGHDRRRLLERLGV